jgi:hypothetical protein
MYIYGVFQYQAFQFMIVNYPCHLAFTAEGTSLTMLMRCSYWPGQGSFSSPPSSFLTNNIPCHPTFNSENWGSTSLQNCIPLEDLIMSQHRRPQSKHSLSWKPENFWITLFQNKRSILFCQQLVQFEEKGFQLCHWLKLLSTWENEKYKLWI